MDKLFDREEKESRDAGREAGASGGLRELIAAKFREAKEERRKNKLSPVLDAVTFLVALVFSRCHLIFGAHPMAVAFVAVLPTRVWIAALGGAVGALTLGRSGIIYAMICAIVVFLRMITSGTDGGAKEGGRLFREGVVLRLSASLIGGFIAAVYETLLSGFNSTTVSFGAVMILVPPALTFALSGLFSDSFDLSRAVFTNEALLSLHGAEGHERYEKIFFQSSALLTSFLVALALSEFNLFGVNLSYIFASMATILVARRFGALRAGAVGFVSTLGLSSVYSVAFALAGLASGALFSINAVYSAIGGVAALGAWCAYAGGLMGFLSTFPEYMIALLLSAPLVKRLPPERAEAERTAVKTSLTDMLGTMSLAYRNKYCGLHSGLEPALLGISSVLRKHSERSVTPSAEEYRRLVRECALKYCEGCSARGECDTPELSADTLEFLTDRLLMGERIESADLSEIADCGSRDAIASAINRASAIFAEERYKAYKKDITPDSFAIMARLMKEAKSADREEKGANTDLSDAIATVLPEYGIHDGAVKVLGIRRPYILIACDDEGGAKISSEKLFERLEEITGHRLKTPEFYRRGSSVLLETSADRSYIVSASAVCRAGDGGEVSGDTAHYFESGDGRFTALISDGMGKGREAKETSQLVTDILSRTLEYECPPSTVLKLLNQLIAGRSEECSASADIFSFDLVTGEASFLKSGAAASYIKRKTSLFRIRSKTAPLGLLGTLDAERIRAEVEAGDTVIMLSDGIGQTVEDAPWLVELLSGSDADEPSVLARKIIGEAEKNRVTSDDMTVLVAKVERK